MRRRWSDRSSRRVRTLVTQLARSRLVRESGRMRADTHDGPELTLQSEAGYSNARPHQPGRRNLLHRTAGPYSRVIRVDCVSDSSSLPIPDIAGVVWCPGTETLPVGNVRDHRGSPANGAAGVGRRSPRYSNTRRVCVDDRKTPVTVLDLARYNVTRDNTRRQQST